ncbi:cytochrome P450 [Streptomyces jumonjinensis]|uniref:cytochrome P450 n=1 Tax=Streptomyces jumonjinensis TaxID=1945 RepID=UPI002B218E1E|nr:cytochrome P450 [Streptomyces jumonjinensis]
MIDTRQSILDWPFVRQCPMKPPPELAELRAKPPCVVRIPAGATPERLAWLVTRHADVQQALKDPRMSADESTPGAPVRIQLPPGDRPSSFLRMDDPEHNRLRSMIATEFTARRVRGLHQPVQALIDDLLDGLAERPRPADLVDAFSQRLPSLVIARLLGVPDTQYDFFVDRTRVTLSQEDPAVAYAAYMDLTAFLRELALVKREKPEDDLMSRLATRHMATGAIDVDQLVGIARLVLVAGHETTTNQIALSVLSLLLDPELKDQVLADDGKLVPAFLEESMRYWSISQDAILRMATEDLELGGVRMSAGDAVVISIPGANHDPGMFPDPERIDVLRDTSEHLQWGKGPHYCQGAPLARLEMELAIKALFRRFPGLRLNCAREDIPFRRAPIFYGLTGLPVTW